MIDKKVVSIVIVDFFKAKRVLENVSKVLSQQGDFEVEVIVIDNSIDAENQGILSECTAMKQVTLIINQQNIGYTQACNQGARLCQGDYLFFVNPDIDWQSENTIQNIISIFEKDEKVGIVGTRQLNDDGSIPDTVRRFPNLPAQIIRRTFLRNLPLLKNIAERYEHVEFDYYKTANVDWVQTSFIGISRKVWEKVNGFDNRYFIFMADPDICYKCWEAGYKVHYESEVVVGADGLRCSAGGFMAVFHSQVLRFHIRDALIYYFYHLLKPRIPTARKYLK